MLFYQLCVLMFEAAQLLESSSRSTDEEYSRDRFRSFSGDTRCGWDCTLLTEADFSKECDPVFTKKRLVKFNVIYDLFVNMKCLNQTSYKPYGTFTDNYTVWIPVNNTLNSFSHGIKGMWDFLVNCFEEGEIRGSCNLEPARPTILASPKDLRTEAATTIEEKGYELITQNPRQRVGMNLLILLSIVCSYYFPSLLCLFSPTLVMESGIRHIDLEGASPVSIRALVGNHVFFKDCSAVASTWYQTGTNFVVRFLFTSFLILLIVPGIIAYNNTPRIFINLTHPFMIVCVTLYFMKWVWFLFFYSAGVSTELRKWIYCMAHREFKSNPGGACLCVDLPQLILNNVKIQPLILAECWSLFAVGLQMYFQRILLLWKGCTGWITRVCLVLVFFPTFPFALISSLLVSLITSFVFFVVSVPNYLIFSEPLLEELYIRLSSMIVRLPAALKISVEFAETCVECLAYLGGNFLLLSASLGVLLTLLLAFSMLLLFPEKSLPFAACFLLFCYYLLSNYSSFTDRYHDLSLIIFNCYKKQTDQISHEEALLNTTNKPSDDKHNGGRVKIPKGLFDMACEEIKPVKESLCLLFFKVVFISSFLFLVFYLTMQLDFGVNPLTKTMVAVFTGLFPKIVCKYFQGEKRRMEALIIEEKAPKIVEAYLKSVLRNNEGQENFGADTDEVSLQIVESEENIAILYI